MTPSERVSRWLKFFLALAISLVFSVLFVRSIDLRKSADALASANYAYVAPALALFALSLVARSIRWRLCYRPQRDVSWQRLLPTLLIGYAGNNLLPLRAGELLRAQVVAERQGVPRMVTFGTLMMERLFDGFILSGFLLWGLLLAGSGGAYLGVGLALFGASSFGFIVATVLARVPNLPARLAARRWPVVPDRIRQEVGLLGESFLSGFSLLTRAPLFAGAALSSAAAWGLELGMYWVLSLAFGLHVSFITIAFAGSAANVALSIPAAQGGVGPFQLVALKALEEFGIASSVAGAYAIALHLFLVGPVSLVGLVVLWRSAVPLRLFDTTSAVPVTPTAPETAD